MSNSLAASAQPDIGLWWNPAKPGRGYTLDLINGNLVLIIYAYDTTGKPEWTIAAGALSGSDWSQQLQRYTFTSKTNTITTQSVGSATLSFQDATHATLSWAMGSNNDSEPIELFSDATTNSPAERAGLWYSPSLNGSGFTFFNQSGKFGAVHYFYDDSGMPTWALGVNSAENSNARKTLAMDVFNDGACLGCAQKTPIASRVGQLDLALTNPIQGVGVSDYALKTPLIITQNNTFQPLLRLSSEQQAQQLASGEDPAFVQANSLTVSDIQTIIAQAVTEARARGSRGTIAIVDRVGNVLAVFRMTGTNTTVKISSERDPLVTTGLEGIELDGLDGAAAIA
ncbi:MAG: heme-binding protein, partial [Methylococcales bacterium]